MQRIADSAGVSRGMPGYAFGSKSALYEAVVERALAQPRALAAQLNAGADEEALAAGVGAYIEFLAGHPTYVLLLQRATLDGGARLGRGGAHRTALADALPLVAKVTRFDEHQRPAARLGEHARPVLLPFAHRYTLLGPLGIDVDDPEFARRLTAHVLSLLHDGLGET